MSPVVIGTAPHPFPSDPIRGPPGSRSADSLTMADAHAFHSLEFDLRNPPYQYSGSRLSWPLPPANEHDQQHQHPHPHQQHQHPHPHPQHQQHQHQQHQHQHQQHQHQHQHQHQPHHDVAAAAAGNGLNKRSTSPLPMSSGPSQTYPAATAYPTAAMMGDWQLPAQVPASTFTLDTAFAPTNYEAYGMPFQTSPTDYMPPQPSLEASLDGNLAAGLPLDGAYVDLANTMGVMGQLPNTMPVTTWELDAGLLDYATPTLLDTSAVVQTAFSGSSPTDSILNDTQLEVVSLPSSSGDQGWATIEHAPSHQQQHQQHQQHQHQQHQQHHQQHQHQHQQHHHAAIFNPEQTLHPRTLSDSSNSSNSDGEQQSRSSLDGYVDLSICGSSPSTDSTNDGDGSDQGGYYDLERPSPLSIATSTQPRTMRPTGSISPPQRSPTSPSAARKMMAKKPPLGKTTSNKIARRSPPNTATATSTAIARIDSNEKRIGRRKGPLRPEQRKQASEIRKLGACIRCRFLKKTCDKGEPCGGCKPSHARLWLVPCTRIDIKDLGYFLKDWKVDYQRHVSLGFSVPNIKGFSEHEIPLFITHGYGQYLPLQSREVYVRDDSCFGVNWTESRYGPPQEHEVDTARLSAGVEGVSAEKLSIYLDRHIDNTFEHFVNEHFEGTPFITEILKTAYRFWTREKIPVIRKALKLVLAYNLTQTICFIKVIGGEDEYLCGMIHDEDSYFKGQTAAPVMINFQVKCALADMWRELQKEILEELSALYSSVYSRDKLKHWPTIFMLAAILLAIWEEMQFDCNYRVPDQSAVEKFCNDMESTPVGVIVGLFSAISQKVPAFSEWETRKHHMMLGSNEAVCTAMEEVRDHIFRHEQYLRSRATAKFDRDNFDSLSNKFVSKLVIRAH